MINFRRLSKYLLAYIILMIISAFVAIGSIIHPIDLAVYKNFHLQSFTNYGKQLNKNKYAEITKEINNKIIFIDIPTTEDNDWLFKFRNDVASLLKIIDTKVESIKESERPVVILDIAFRSDTTAQGQLENALFPLLIEKKMNVYAAYLMPENKNLTFGEHDKDQNKTLYDYYFTGNRLNTVFENHLEVNGLLSYNSYESIDTLEIESLPVRVARDYKREGNKPDSIKLDPAQYIVPLKLPFEEASRDEIYYIFTNDSMAVANNSFSNLKDTDDLANKFIIIGTPGDRLKIGKTENNENFDVPGPYVVATALIDQLNDNNFTKPPYDNAISQLGLTIFFAFFVCLIFAAIYKYIKKLQTRPSLIAILSWLLGVAIFLYLGYLLLEFTVIRPTLPVISMLWASFLSWHFTKKFLVTGIMEGGEVYDVFISYSFGDSSWVKQHLFSPLSELKKADGSNLKIFFAEKSIGIGELFTTKYMRAIVDSKLFVPVMSQEYYKKNHCKNEMDLAMKRNIEKLISICIVAFDYKFVPEEFTNVLMLDVNQNSNFMSTIRKEVLDIEEIQTEEILPEIKKPDAVLDPVNQSEVPEVKDVVQPINTSSISQEIVKGGGLHDLEGKGIIIINNGDGNLTITTNGITLTLNGNKEKKKKKNKAINKKSKKKRKKDKKKNGNKK